MEPTLPKGCPPLLPHPLKREGFAGGQHQAASGGHTVKLPMLLLVFSTNLSAFVQKMRGRLSKSGSAPLLHGVRNSPPPPNNRSISWPSSAWREVLLLFSSSLFGSFPFGLELNFNELCSVPLESIEMVISAGLIFTVTVVLAEPGWERKAN